MPKGYKRATKVCNACERRKPASAFYRVERNRDGLSGTCKACCRARTRRNRKARIEHYRAYDRARSRQPQRQEKVIAAVKDWRTRYPGRYRAQNAVNNALRDGRLEKPERCEDCGGKARLHGHHEDYRRPLDVVWLCTPCHAARHNGRAP